jgi:hypothetical protein
VGEDLNGGGGARGGGAGMRHEPRWRARGWCGPQHWRQSAWHRGGGGQRSIEADVEEWSMRHRCGGSRCGIEADAEEE